MPRVRKTTSGAPAQKIASVTGQRYGEGVAQQSLQRQLPAPDLVRQTSNALSAGVADSGGSPATPASPQMTPEQRYEAVMQAARGTQAAGLLTQPTARPSEPVTTGLPIGPGPGPEAIQPMGATPTGAFFAQVARLTGNPYFEQLAKRAGL